MTLTDVLKEAYLGANIANKNADVHELHSQLKQSHEFIISSSLARTYECIQYANVWLPYFMHAITLATVTLNPDQVKQALEFSAFAEGLRWTTYFLGNGAGKVFRYETTRAARKEGFLKSKS